MMASCLLFSPYASIVLTSVEDNFTGSIRFAASVSPSVQRIDDIEYGFIVTRESFIDEYFDGELSFESAINDKVYVYGTNFKSENGKVTKDISNGALDLLKENGIECRFSNTTIAISNRRGDGICPMEKTVAPIKDPERAYLALREKVLSSNN